MANLVGLALKEQEQRRLRRKYGTNLWLLCTEILGYDKLDATFHRPMLDQMDVWRAKGKRRTLCLWPRGHYKTTAITIGGSCQDLLLDPDDTILILHAVEEEVLKIVDEIGTHFQRTKDFRRLFPDGVAPSINDKRFLKASRFTLNRKTYNRQPSVLGKSAGSEITGAHCNRIKPDDIVGRNTIEDSQLPKVRSWWRNTVLPVLNPDGTINASATRWDVDDLAGEWLSSRGWQVQVRSSLETDGKMDYQGTPVLFTADELKRRRKEMGESDFAFQMMNDPSPAGEKPWDRAKCEHFISLKEASGPGFVVVLTDPAPAKTGSFDGRGEKQRGDGSKDPWAIEVVKLRTKGQRREIIWLDGEQSREWTHEEGFRRVCQFQRKWNSATIAIEATGQAIALYTEDHRRIARTEGVRHNPIQLTMTYKGKNTQFAALCARATNDEFLICTESVPKEHLDEGLLQLRDWRPLATGRNSLRYDDIANCLSFSCDPALTTYFPQVMPVPEWNPLEEEEAEEEFYRSRYCAV